MISNRRASLSEISFTNPIEITNSTVNIVNLSVSGSGTPCDGDILPVPRAEGGMQGGGGFTAGVAGLVLAPTGTLGFTQQVTSPSTAAITFAIYCSDASASGLTNIAVNASLVTEEWF